METFLVATVLSDIDSGESLFEDVWGETMISSPCYRSVEFLIPGERCCNRPPPPNEAADGYTHSWCRAASHVVAFLGMYTAAASLSAV